LAFASFAAISIWGIGFHWALSGANDQVVEICSPSVVDTFSKSYGTGVRGVDQVLCQFNETFQALLSGKAKDTTTVFFWTMPVIVFASLLESTRTDRPIVASYPLIFGILYQTMTGGFVISAFWGLFLWSLRPGSGTGSAKLARAPITRANAEAALTAVVLGYYAPTTWMIMTKSPLAVVLWQPFTVYMSIIQHLVYRIRSQDHRRANELGLSIVRAGFMITSTISTISYIAAVMPNISETIVMDFLQWLPSLSIPEPSTTTIASAALQLIQYDAAMSLASSILAAILLLPIRKDQAFAAETTPMLLVVAGPGVIIGGLWVLREEFLVKRFKYFSEKAKEK
jgi:hypothetical protein